MQESLVQQPLRLPTVADLQRLVISNGVEYALRNTTAEHLLNALSRSVESDSELIQDINALSLDLFDSEFPAAIFAQMSMNQLLEAFNLSVVGARKEIALFNESHKNSTHSFVDVITLAICVREELRLREPVASMTKQDRKLWVEQLGELQDECAQRIGWLANRAELVREVSSEDVKSAIIRLSQRIGILQLLKRVLHEGSLPDADLLADEYR